MLRIEPDSLSSIVTVTAENDQTIFGTIGSNRQPNANQHVSR